MSTITESYLDAYNRAMAALKSIDAIIHKYPAPDGETELTWGHVADMAAIMAKLEEIADEN